jgi:hypothetical protein
LFAPVTRATQLSAFCMATFLQELEVRQIRRPGRPAIGRGNVSTAPFPKRTSRVLRRGFRAVRARVRLHHRAVLDMSNCDAGPFRWHLTHRSWSQSPAGTS